MKKVAFILLMLLVVYYWHRRHDAKAHASAPADTPAASATASASAAVTPAPNARHPRAARPMSSHAARLPDGQGTSKPATKGNPFAPLDNL